jgi:hypothetical protein
MLNHVEEIIDPREAKKKNFLLGRSLARLIELFLLEKIFESR